MQEAIFKLSDDDDCLTADNSMDTEFEELYVEVKIRLHRFIKKFAPNETFELLSVNVNENVSANCNKNTLDRILEQQAELLSRVNVENPQNRKSEVQLPRILPDFAGKIKQLRNFCGMFKSLIHDNKE